MRFNSFTKKIKTSIYGSPVLDEQEIYGEMVAILEDGRVFINREETQLKSLEEAREYISQIKLEEEISRELYNDIPDVKIANIIREYHDIKVTDTLIESYTTLASSKLFSVDPVVQEIRRMCIVDNIIEGKIDYVLSDGSVVAIDEHTNLNINKLLQNQPEIVEYMRESKGNFMRIIKELN